MRCQELATALIEQTVRMDRETVENAAKSLLGCASNVISVRRLT